MKVWLCHVFHNQGKDKCPSKQVPDEVLKEKAKEFNKEISKIIQLWNDEMLRNSITQEMFVKNILLDLNFAPEGFFLAWEKDELVGFVYTVIRKYRICCRRFPKRYTIIELSKR